MYLVEIKSNNFSAIMPPISQISYKDLAPIYENADNPDKQALCALDLFVSQLAPDKVDEFTSLNMIDIQEAIATWMAVGVE